MTPHVNEELVVATSKEINSIIDRIEPIILNIPKGKVLIALISIILVMQNPDITTTQLRANIRDVSKFICMILHDGTVSTERMN